MVRLTILLHLPDDHNVQTKNAKFQSPKPKNNAIIEILIRLLQLGHLPSKRQDAVASPPPMMPFFQP